MKPNKIYWQFQKRIIWVMGFFLLACFKLAIAQTVNCSSSSLVATNTIGQYLYYTTQELTTINNSLPSQPNSQDLNSVINYIQQVNNNILSAQSSFLCYAAINLNQNGKQVLSLLILEQNLLAQIEIYNQLLSPPNSTITQNVLTLTTQISNIQSYIMNTTVINIPTQTSGTSTSN